MRPQATDFAEIFDFGLWSEWFAQLDRGFIFLLLLPFVVALIGLWAWFTEEEARERRVGEADRRKSRAGEHPAVGQDRDRLQQAHRK
jgi:hypothetical protein